MNEEDARKLAEHHAPIFAQKVSAEWKAADMIAPIDFAGSFENVNKNPDKFLKLRHGDTDTLKPIIYYSVCETKTHFYIIYAVYHILDWWKRLKPINLYDLIRESLDEHIHDMEGALFVIRNEQEEPLDAIITIAHDNFYLYTNPPPPKEGLIKPGREQKYRRIVKFNETIDGHIWPDKQSKRIKLYIQSKGHGIYGDHKHWGGGEEIWYYHHKSVESDPRPKDTINPKKKGDIQPDIGLKKEYELESIFQQDGLWDYRSNTHVFLQNKKGKWGFVYYDEKKKRYFGGSANPPWSWNDRNDLNPMGEIATDPARLIIQYAQGWGPVSTHYNYNPYLGITESEA